MRRAYVMSDLESRSARNTFADAMERLDEELRQNKTFVEAVRAVTGVHLLHGHSREAIANWLATDPSNAEKDATHGRLVNEIGWEQTVKVWAEGHELARRRRSTCRASREYWPIVGVPDADGLYRCPDCDDRVSATYDGAVLVFGEHRVETKVGAS